MRSFVLAHRMADEVVVDLAGAEHETLDLLVIDARLAEHGEELRVGEVLDAVRGRVQPQQRLRRHDHERPQALAQGLRAQQVEVLRRRREVRDADVALRRELQEPLQAGRGVFRTGPFVAVRQQQREPRGLAPLGQAAHDELVDDDLRAVAEVAELGFPEDERLGGLLGVAVFEAEAGGLAERRVVQLERGLGPGELLDRRERLPVLEVVQHGVALGEGAALGVLARESHRDAVTQQRGVARATRRAPSRSRRLRRARCAASRARS